VTPKEARIFSNYWRKTLFNGVADQTIRDGFIYAPLQGRLKTHRSFQYCSPLEILELILEHDPSRSIKATLHPKETHTQAELGALEKLTEKPPR